MNLYELIYFKDHDWYITENEDKVVLLLNDILEYTIYDKVEEVLKEFASRFDIHDEIRLPSLDEVKNLPKHIKKINKRYWTSTSSINFFVSEGATIERMKEINIYDIVIEKNEIITEFGERNWESRDKLCGIRPILILESLEVQK